MSSRTNNFVERIERGVSSTIQSVEQGIDNWFDRKAEQIWDQYRPRIEATADEIVDKQIRKYSIWIIILYALVGLAVLFSVFSFIKLSQRPRC